MAPSRACFKCIGRSRRLQISGSCWFSQPHENVPALLYSVNFINRSHSAPFTTSSLLAAAEPIPPNDPPNTKPPPKSAHLALGNLASSIIDANMDPRGQPGFSSNPAKPRSSASFLSALTQTDHDHVAALMRVAPRQYWNRGQTYAPHDLSSVEAIQNRRAQFLRNTKGQPLAPTRAEFKDSRGRRRRMDVVDQLGINPLDEYKNISIMQEFMGPTGRIKHPKETGLRAVNQRKIAKAIRRAVGMGLLGSVHRHPEMLEAERKEQLEREDFFRDRVAKSARDQRRGRGR